MSDYSTVGEQIKEYLELLIEQNRSNPHYILPSENQLAHQFKSSRSPAKKALADLRDAGVIYSVQGKGTFIKQDGLTQNELRILLIVPHIDTPYLWDIVKGIRDFFFDKKVHLLITLSENDPQAEEQTINFYTAQPLAGLLLFPIVNATYHTAMLKLALTKRPVVTISHYLPGIGFSSVYCDSYNQMHHAVTLLLEKGHTDIGLIAESEDYNNAIYRGRASAFRDCMKNKLGKKHAFVLGVEVPPHTENEQIKAKIRDQIGSFFREHENVTAVIVSAILAKDVIHYLRDKRPEAPISAIIIDKPEDLQELSGENIYVIDQKPYEIGQRAASQLYDQIVNGKEREEIVLSHEIIPSLEMVDE